VVLLSRFHQGGRLQLPRMAVCTIATQLLAPRAGIPRLTSQMMPNYCELCLGLCTSMASGVESNILPIVVPQFNTNTGSATITRKSTWPLSSSNATHSIEVFVGVSTRQGRSSRHVYSISTLNSSSLEKPPDNFLATAASTYAKSRPRKVFYIPTGGEEPALSTGLGFVFSF
jgi:hypothetical protein